MSDYKFNSSRTKGHDQVFDISCAWTANYFQTNNDVIRTDVFYRENNNRIRKDCLFNVHVINRKSYLNDPWRKVVSKPPFQNVRKKYHGREIIRIYI